MSQFRFPDGVEYLGGSGNEVRFNVSMPTDDDGHFGRECPNCNKILRVSADDYDALPDDLTLWCAYCGHSDDHSEVTDQARNTRAELGWVLAPAYTGHGYTTEAVRALLTYCFDELKVRRVVANCFLDNDASWRLMERLGMRREAHAIAESLHRSGEWLDTVAYAMLASEWEGRLAHG